MRFHTLLAAALLLLSFSAPGFSQDYGPGPYRPRYPDRPPAVRPAEGRTFWAYGPGDRYTFRQMTDGRWVQDAGDMQYYFEEANRTPDYVELFDPSRKMGARLYGDGLWTRAPGWERFHYSLPGHWLY
jgi:hypothetical protein